MGSYDCVIPISWPLLKGEVLPAWSEVLKGQRTCVSFCNEFIHGHDDRLIAISWCDEVKGMRLPSNYLESIGWSSEIDILSADRLRDSSVHRSVQQAIQGWGDYALCQAIQSSASVELSGIDPFVEDRHISYYGSLCDLPKVQVAGTKNGFQFLEVFFTRVYHRYPNPFYTFINKGRINDEVVELLGALFLSLRSFPGCTVTEEAWSWPAYDDCRIQGYLSPDEVPLLVRHLVEIASLHPEVYEDELFPLLQNRVQRAAEEGLGLVTMVDSL